MAKVSKHFLLQTLSDKSYPYDFMEGMDPRYAHQFPIFNFITIESMLLDSRIEFALGLIKGPIHTYTKFFNSADGDNPQIQQGIIDRDYFFSYKVQAETKEQEDYIVRQLSRFWEVATPKALTAIEWGYSGSQVIYRKDKNNLLHFDNLHLYNARKVRPVSVGGKLVGMVYKTNEQETFRYYPLPKCFWHVHKREINQYTGRSRLKGAHIPWHETWTLGGARDIRRIWFYKNSYNGGMIRYPEGEIIKDEVGNEIPAIEIAQKLISELVTGGYLLLPNKKQGSDSKDYAWDYEPPSGGVTPDGLMEYPQQLRKEILEGIGIPPEVVEAAGSQGFGSATGRKVPYMGFIASLYPLVSTLIGDFRNQILDNLLLFAYGQIPDYDVVPIIPLGESQDNITGVESDTGMGE